MKLFLTSLFLMLAISCSAQVVEIGYSPVSVIGWGKIPELTKLDASLLIKAYHSEEILYLPGIRYSYINSRSTARDDLGDDVKGTFNTFFLIPASFDVLLNNFSVLGRVGFGFSDKSFPNKNGLTMNFLLETGLKYTITNGISLSARYSHISNADQGTTNPGVDNIIFASEFYF